MGDSSFMCTHRAVSLIFYTFSYYFEVLVLIRHPGCLRQTRGFPSPPRDGFGFSPYTACFIMAQMTLIGY